MSNTLEGLDITNYQALNSTEIRGKILKVVSEAFLRLDPEKLLGGCIKEILSGAREYRNVYVIGFGKASLKMYRGIRDRTSQIAKYSAVIIPEGEKVIDNYPELEILMGNHPVPSRETLFSSRKILESIGELHNDDLVIVLISGGGSALFEIPEEGYTIEKIGETAKCLMDYGADINELNAVRKTMSQVKGGKLARKLYPSEVYAFIISDVPGDNLSVIASGPLTRTEINAETLDHIVEKYGEKCGLPAKEDLVRHSGQTDVEYFRNVTTRVILKNSDFVNLMSTLLLESGEKVSALEHPVTGDVEETAQWFARKMRSQFELTGGPVWIVSGGETTVKVSGNGKGGRNSELALRVALNMGSEEKFLFAGIGTDGIDGTSPAMGGITDTSFLERCKKSEILNSLSMSDSYTLLNKYNSAIITGYTGTNVSDIYIAYYAGTGE